MLPQPSEVWDNGFVLDVSGFCDDLGKVTDDQREERRAVGTEGKIVEMVNQLPLLKGKIE